VFVLVNPFYAFQIFVRKARALESGGIEEVGSLDCSKKLFGNKHSSLFRWNEEMCFTTFPLMQENGGLSKKCQQA
jgi:hypothetical protein